MRVLASWRRDILRNRYVYFMALPVIAYYLLFCYKPMYGIVIAFQNYKPALGIADSKWVGLKHFYSFFQGAYFRRVLLNTLYISVMNILWGFPAPILLALLLNEVRSARFKKTVQTITYIPHFISIVVICGMIRSFSETDGVFNDIIAFFGGTRTPLLARSDLFVPIHVVSGIWRSIGWGSIIYLAAITSVDQELYEAATLDGAGKLRQTWHITLAGIAPTITIMFILRIGGLMNVGYEKIMLLYNDLIMDRADVISTYVYRKGLLDSDYSYSTAVGLFNTVINFILVIAANTVSRRLSETSLW